MSDERPVPGTVTVKGEVNPQPVMWPECSECFTPYVLRLAWYFGGGREWAWQRDCKHKKAEPQIAVKESEA